MGRKVVYSNEFKQSVVEFYKSHTMEDTAKEFSIPRPTVAYIVKLSGYKKGNAKVAMSLKHEVCQYYDNHTAHETVAKFGVSLPSLFIWRRELGYRNKSRGYNLYTEGLQPTVTKRERRNFVMTKAENGDLKAELHKRDERIADLEVRLTQLEDAANLVNQLKQLLN
jgi:transposase-like protein